MQAMRSDEGEPESIKAARLSERMVAGLLEDEYFKSLIIGANYPKDETDLEAPGSMMLMRVAHKAGLSPQHIIAASKVLRTEGEKKTIH